MSNKYRKTVVLIAVAAGSIITGGCTTSQPRQPRYLGCSETVKQGDKQLFAHATLTERERVTASAELRGGGHVKQTMATTVQLAGFKQAIIRRDLPAGGFEGNFGRETNLVFSIQRCNQVEIQNGVPVCGEKSAALPVAVQEKVSLVGGQTVKVQLPEGVEWTFTVLDQASPLVSN